MTPLEQASAEYEERGFAIIRDVIPEDLPREARSHVEWLSRRTSDGLPASSDLAMVSTDVGRRGLNFVSSTRAFARAER